MKLLVTGGAGFIGSAVVRLAVSRGIDVINLDALTYAARLENLDSVADAPNYTFVHADICNSDALARVFSKHQPDAVMHLAAETHVDRSIVGPRTFIDSNIVGTYVLLETARKNWGGGGILPFDSTMYQPMRFMALSAILAASVKIVRTPLILHIQHPRQPATIL